MDDGPSDDVGSGVVEFVRDESEFEWAGRSGPGCLCTIETGPLYTSGKSQIRRLGEMMSVARKWDCDR